MKKIITSILLAFALVPVQGQNTTININGGKIDVHSDEYNPLVILNGELLPPDSVKWDELYEYLCNRQLSIKDGNIYLDENAKKRFSEKYGKNADHGVIDVTAIPDTLCDEYVCKHPEMKAKLRRVEGVALDESTGKPIKNVHVWVYEGGGNGTMTDDKGHFVLWMKNKDNKIAVSRKGYGDIRGIQPTDETLTIRMKQKDESKVIRVR